MPAAPLSAMRWSACATCSRSRSSSADRALTSLWRHPRRLDLRQTSALEHFVDLRQFDLNPTLEIMRDVAELASDRRRALDLHLGRQSLVADDASIELGEILAEPLFAGDH